MSYEGKLKPEGWAGYSHEDGTEHPACPTIGEGPTAYPLASLRKPADTCLTNAGSLSRQYFGSFCIA